MDAARTPLFRTPLLNGKTAAILFLLGLSCTVGGRRRDGSTPMTAPASGSRVSRPEGAAIAAEFARTLRSMPPERFAEALVDLADQADLDALRRRFDQQGLSRSRRRRETIAALEEVAARRRPLEAWLDRELLSGAVDVWRGYAIVNRLYISAKPSLLLEMAGRPEVANIFPVRDDRISPAPGEERAQERVPFRLKADDRPVPQRSWALDTIGAREAWHEGWDGRGIVVGSLDTGVAAKHVSLSENHRQTAGWFDPLRGTTEPNDDHGHGTETLGCAVGRGKEPGEVGIGPGATWIAARANPRNFYNSHAMTASADWMLRVGGADVVLCAWGHDPGRCDVSDQPVFRALRLAEVVVALPAGNSGPMPGSAETPAGLAPLFKGDLPPLSVAAATSTGAILDSSARGPSPCSPETQFPWVSAPGFRVRVPSSVSVDSYDSADGTSLAAGYVAGAAAVLLQRCPSLDVNRLEEALARTATDLGQEGPDNDSGYGMINLPAALRWVAQNCH